MSQKARTRLSWPRWKVEHKKTVTKLWLDAQVMFYGLGTAPETREYRLKEVRNWIERDRVGILQFSV